jgi:hypothetical protein
MNRYLSKIRDVFFLIFLVVAGLLGLLCCFVCTNMDSASRSDVPLTRHQIGKELDLPFPDSASDIYFFQFAGGLQDLEVFVRFDVAPADLSTTAEALVAHSNRNLGLKAVEMPQQPLGEVEWGAPREDFLPMPWWNPSAVKHGYYRCAGPNERASYQLEILVDEEHARIYIRQND